MIAIVSDLNMIDEPVTYQLVEYKETNNKKVVMITKSLLFKTLRPGEMEFVYGTTIPKRFIQATHPYEILILLFTKF